MHEKIKFCDGGEITVTRERVMANNMRTCHSHNAYELYFLTEGVRYLYAEGFFYKLHSGDAFLASPGVMHRTLDEGGGYSKFVIMLPKSFVPSSFSDSIRVVSLCEGVRSELLLLIDGAEREKSDAAWLFVSMRLLSAVLSSPTAPEKRVETPALGRIGEILDYLESNFTERITLTSLSEHFFISEYYLCRLFKEYTGRTLGEYVSNLRVERAKLLLSDGMPVNRVWRASGFGSESSFNRTFRERVGCAPREWKNKKN